MKAILVSIANKERKVCTTSEEAISFLQSQNIVVNSISEQHLAKGFELINSGNENKRGGHGYYFSAGNNSKNPSIYLDNVTGNFSVSEMSPENIKNAVSEVELQLKEKQSDFKLNSYSSTIEGGFNWYYVQRDQRHYAIHEFWMRSTEFSTIEDLKAYILERGNQMIAKYGK